MAPSIPEQLSHIKDQLTSLSQSFELIQQRWEQENVEADTLRKELSSARALNERFQIRNQNLEAQLAQRKSSGARHTLGRFLREDVARANERLTHAREHDIISNSDVGDDVESEYGSVGTSVSTVRGRNRDSESKVAATDSGEEDRKSGEVPDDYLSPPSQLKPGALPSTSPGPSNNRVGQIATDSRTVESPASSIKRYHETPSATSASGTLSSDFIPESFAIQSNAPQWTIQIQKPPVSARVRCGPMKGSHLSQKLGIEEDTAISLKSLLSNDNLGLGVRIQGDCAFVYDPIFLENLDTTTPMTYLFDWGNVEANQNITQYIQEKNEQKDAIFHTFVYILKPRRWYYVGAQQWAHTDLNWNIWETFGQRDHIRYRVIQRLYDHCGKKIERETIAEMLDSGVLKQICIHLSGGDSHIDSSRTMCIAMGYSPPEN
ncbi:hypothetical protein C8R41DRAFT_186048 [Lentinula lateritia]|uniref:Uncharacterized protein n=1 Tax=Lentinula lateritia TaxID=40482 RepID=A0ABQ8VMZ8_9AGAR|nr:hypothetical protein C8R41DRAFT_186048 [Lentinula lateritia]